MKNTTHKFSRPYKRKIHMPDGVWTWRMNGFQIWVRSPNGKRTLQTTAYELAGTTANEWYEDHSPERDSSMDFAPWPSIAPSDIKTCIEVNVFGA